MSDMIWVYLRSESQLYTVGFYEPSGKWQPESDHSSPEEAAKRVHYLNGGDESCGQPERDARILAESNIELLEVLEKAAELIGDLLTDRILHGTQDYELHKAMIAAIHKAKGE